MSILRPKNFKICHVDETSQDLQLSKPVPYSKGQMSFVNIKYAGKHLYIQTPRMLNIFGLNTYKDEKTDRIKNVSITLQFASDSSTMLHPLK